MKLFIRLTVLCLMLGLSSIEARDSSVGRTVSPEEPLVVTIIYDNYHDDTSLTIDWGFACLVEYGGDRLLFDAGRKADLYKENLGKLGIDPTEIPALFISHEHGDHTAGMPWITTVNKSVRCYLPSTYAANLESNNMLPNHSKGLLSPEHLYGSFYSTGDQFEAFREQGLVVKTENGGILITGCGHPGVVEMVTAANKELGIQIHTIIGGLHLMQTPEKTVIEIASSLKEMGISQICPTHCTGDKSIAVLEDSFGEGYISGGTGKKITIQ